MKYLLICLALVFASEMNAQGPQSNKMSDVIREVMIMDNSDGEMSISFWIPESYWALTAEVSPDVSLEVADYIKDIMRPYIITLTANTEIAVESMFEFATEEEILKTIKLVDAEGNKYTPLEYQDIDYEARNVINSMKPVFTQMVGAMGEGLHFFIFENADAQGNPIIDESKEGSFTIIHSGRSFRYSTPLVTLMPPQYCPKDNREMKGNWKFCPFHGVELSK